MCCAQVTVARLRGLFGQGRSTTYNKIILRRTEAAAGQCIAFHLDDSLQTMQVPLNARSEYDGGRLVFALGDGSLVVPEREVGSAIIHDDGVVHGVTEITRGVRCGLFLLTVPHDCGV